jgi:DNA polymerase III subunit epsilon
MDAAEVPSLPLDLVFVDLETTGGNAAYHRITEVGIVRVQNGGFVEEWSSLVNPGCRIPAHIEAFTGISNEMVADAPTFADLAPIVLAKLQGAVFVAHNARFDYSFLRSEFRRVETRFNARTLCTVKLSRRLFPEQFRHSLDAVMERHQLTCSARHRALGDARVLYDFWGKLRRDLTDPVLGAAVQTLLAAGKLPAQLPADFADDLPDGPGVYRFFGEDGALLYIGKSNSLRTRVLAHFAAEHTDSKQQTLARQVRRADWVETAGELGALLRESAWVKTQRPLHNRRLKNTAGSFTLRLAPAGADPVSLVSVDAFEPADLAQCFGLFRSRNDAVKALTDIARAQQLCLKLLGLETGAGSCFAHQVGKCRGACVGKEPAIMHKMRLQLALSALKLKPWPFPGRIGLRERDWRGDTDLHVCDNWVYLGTARSDEELAALCGGDATECRDAAEFGDPGMAARTFDPDVYRILSRHFAKTPKLDWIDLRRPQTRS